MPWLLEYAKILAEIYSYKFCCKFLNETKLVSSFMELKNENEEEEGMDKEERLRDMEVPVSLEYHSAKALISG